jgi:DNA mismatch endonuclease (patch repair protein)
MADVLTPQQRRLNMSRIKGTNTKPEMLLRSALHAQGLRFRVHRRDLPGRPDIVFIRQKTAVFVHGCFWHQHGCPYSTMPATREDFWKAKLAGNAQRDERTLQKLKEQGWRVAVVWECALRGKGRLPPTTIAKRLESFLHSNKNDFVELRGASQRQT